MGETPAANEFGAFVPGPRCRLAATAGGALDGLSFAVKDLIDVAGCRTGCGNPDWLCEQKPAQRSASAVELLLAAGAALTGKTITDELAFSLEGRNVHYGTPINPACADRFPGGSSSGSAVVVAGGLADFALGTDTGGSVRVPASFVGVFGFRPTHGAIPLDGVMPFAPSYDTIGWFARDAAVLARVGGVLLPPRSAEPITRLLRVTDAFMLADAASARALNHAIAHWPVAAGIEVFAGAAGEWRECYRVLQGAEIWQRLGSRITRTRPRFGADIAARFADAAAISGAEVDRCRPFRDAFAARLRTLIPADTALIVPTAPCAALPLDASGDIIGDFYRRALTLTSIAGHSGAPQVTLPIAAANGCPLGVSLIAAPGCDLALLDLAVRLSRRR